jgi:hypothetical protein
MAFVMLPIAMDTKYVHLIHISGNYVHGYLLLCPMMLIFSFFYLIATWTFLIIHSRHHTLCYDEKTLLQIAIACTPIQIPKNDLRISTRHRDQGNAVSLPLSNAFSHVHPGNKHCGMGVTNQEKGRRTCNV